MLLLLLLLCAAAVVIQQSSFDSNSADMGGAIAVYQAPLVQVRECNFVQNTAFNALITTGSGGAVHVSGQAWPPGGTGVARMVVLSSNFTDNMANTGGAIYMKNATSQHE
jgi:predicted outer membrane repeat protein